MRDSETISAATRRSASRLRHHDHRAPPPHARPAVRALQRADGPAADAAGARATTLRARRALEGRLELGDHLRRLDEIHHPGLLDPGAPGQLGGRAAEKAAGRLLE